VLAFLPERSVLPVLNKGSPTGLARRKSDARSAGGVVEPRGFSAAGWQPSQKPTSCPRRCCRASCQIRQTYPCRDNRAPRR